MGRAMGVKIAGIGSFVPENLVTNDDLAALGCDSEWIVRRTGIRQRYHAKPGQSTCDLSVIAAQEAIKDAGVTESEIDLVIVATITPDHPTPSTACTLQKRLGIFAPAMDVSAACAGFVYGLVTAANFIVAGNASKVLVVGADLMSRTINPDDKKTFPLFGDGAGAMILTTDAKKDRGLLSYQLGSEGDEGEMLCIPAGGTRQPMTVAALQSGQQYMRMDGRNVFKWAVRLVDETARETMQHAGVNITELDHLIFHQANQRIIDSAVSDLHVDADKVFMNLDRLGNTSAASIPLAMDELKRDGKLREGQKILLCGFGSGLAWGTTIIQM
jgi:3-oxoacyl-[acyl-carrier-protein] synthase III